MGWNGLKWKKHTISHCFTLFYCISPEQFFLKWVWCFNWKKKIAIFVKWSEMAWNDFTTISQPFQTISDHFTTISNHFTTISDHFTTISDHFRPFQKTHFRPFQRSSLKWKNPFQPILGAEMGNPSFIWWKETFLWKIKWWNNKFKM